MPLAAVQGVIHCEACVLIVRMVTMDICDSTDLAKSWTEAGSSSSSMGMKIKVSRGGGWASVTESRPFPWRTNEGDEGHTTCLASTSLHGAGGFF